MCSNLQTIKNLYITCCKCDFSMDFKTAMRYYTLLAEFKKFIEKIPKRAKNFDLYYKQAKTYQKQLELFCDF